MNELSELFKAAPQSAIVGATVYLILTTRRTDARVEEIAAQIGLAPRKKRRVVGLLIAVGVSALLFTGCTVTRKCTKAGCTTHIGVATNAVPALKAIGGWLK